MKRSSNFLVLLLLFSMFVSVYFVYAVAPSVNSVTLNSTSPLNSTNGDLVASAVSSSENGNVTEAYYWYKNGVLNRTTLIENNLSFYYPFDNDVYDYYGANDNGHLSGSAVLNSSKGLKEGGLYFDATTNGTAFNTSYKIPSGTTELTVNIWVKYYGDSSTIYPFILNNIYTTNVSGFYLASHSGSIRGRVWNKEVAVSDTPYINSGKWNMFTLTFKDNNSIKLYVNGKEVSENLLNDTILPVSPNNVFIGGLPLDNGWAVFLLNGSVDEPMLWTRQLNDSEIRQLYNGYRSQKVIDSSNLTAGDVWKFGVKALDNSSISSELNSTSITIEKGPILNLQFPKEKMVIQRNALGIGKLNIFGNITGNLISSFNMTYSGNSSGVLNIPVNSSGYFNQTIYLKQGDYTFSFDSYDGNIGHISQFGVGDVIIIDGQSNAVDSSNNDNSVVASTYGVYLTKYMAEWLGHDCAVANTTYQQLDLGTLNRWSELGNDVSRNQHIPVNIVNLAVGGRGIDYLTNTCLPYDYGVISDVTGGTMQVRGIYWYQGENDESQTAEWYYDKLKVLKNDFFEHLNFPYGEKNLVVGQVLATPTTPPLGNLRLGIQNAWNNISGIYKGSVMYDIKTNDLDSVHPSGAGKTIFERRNNRAMLYYLYSLFGTSPVLQDAYYYNASRLILRFDDSNLEVSDWNETVGLIPKGIRIHQLNLTSLNISSVSIINNFVIINYNSSVLSIGKNLSLCDVEMDCYNQTVIRSSDYLIPAEIVWNKSIVQIDKSSCDGVGYYWYSDSCHITAPVSTENTTQVSGGLPTYHITESNLQKGYSKLLNKNWKLKFNFKDEEHKLQINSIKNNSVTITVSSNPITFNLSINETKKIDLDNNGYYDFSVSLKNITGNSYYHRADIYVKLINEKILKNQDNSTKEVNQWREPKNTLLKNAKSNRFIYEMVGIILLIIVIIFLVFKFKSKKI